MAYRPYGLEDAPSELLPSEGESARAWLLRVGEFQSANPDAKSFLSAELIEDVVQGAYEQALEAAASDERFPTSGEKAALVGTAGAPSVGNPFVTSADPRLLAVTRTLTWDADTENYVPAELRADTSMPRVFFGPVPPVDDEDTPLAGVVMNPLPGWDAWRPSGGPS